MHRIDGPGATVDNKFTDGDPIGGIQATIVTDEWLNDVQEELMSILAGAGIAPVKGLQNQVLNAIRGGSSSFGTDTGTTNSIVVSLTPAVTAFADSMVIRVLIASANTAATTLSLNALGPKGVVGLAGQPLQGGEVVSGGHATFMWGGSANVWILLSCQAGASQVAPASKSQHALQLGQANALYGGNTTLVSSSGVTTLTSANAGLVLIDATAGNIAVGLPVASTTGSTFQFVRTDSSANTVTIARSSTDTIGGTTSITLVGQYSTTALRSNGSNSWSFLTGAQRGIVRFTSSGSWVCPAGITTVYASGVAGGGGGGGGGSGVTGAGGGAGQSDIRRTVTVVPGTTYTITIGTAGSGGALNTAGGTGGITSFGALFSWAGGVGGSSNGPGGNSGGGSFSQSGQTVSSTVSGIGGQGGSSAFGGGGQGGIGGNTGVPAASNTGAGGGGGAGGGSGNVGASGGAGLLILEW